MQHTPSVSVLIPTHSREACLKECLQSLRSLDYPKDRLEIIVVDDCSSDGTIGMLENIKDTFSCRFFFLHHTERRGISAARNSGIKKARGEIIVFTDDDCIFEKDWISNMVAPFHSVGVGIVGAPDRVPDKSPLFSRCIGCLFTSFIGTGGLRRGKGVRLGRYYPKGCNIAVLREAIEEAGYFDESLCPSEEIELGYRIRRCGYKIEYLPRALVWHRRQTTFKALLNKVFRIGFNRAMLLRKHKGLFQIGQIVPFLGIIWVLFLSIVSLFTPNALIVLGFTALSYGMIVLTASLQAFIRLRDIRAAFVIFFLVPFHHMSHGFGFLAGLVSMTKAFKSPLN